MSATALDSGLNKAMRFYQATIGKKAVIAVTGFILFGYLIGHLIGNLQLFAGDPAVINAYAAFLHARPGVLWMARLVLLTAVILHIVLSVQLALQNRRVARPTPYVKFNPQHSTYASRTMIWSGPIILAFVIFHVANLTFGAAVGGPTGFDQANVYNNVVYTFLNPLTSIFYIVAMVLLGFHLYHGLWSMFQSLGVSHPRYTPWLKLFAKVLALFIALGNISIPVAVMAGLVRPV
jgi:succinate dehydrogenase / fumarate reductase, cytochrome b subunit